MAKNSNEHYLNDKYQLLISCFILNPKTNETKITKCMNKTRAVLVVKNGRQRETQSNLEIFQMAANRTILIVEGLPMAHLNAHGPYFSKHPRKSS